MNPSISNALGPPPLLSSPTDDPDARMSPALAMWLQRLYKRVGGPVSDSNTDLSLALIEGSAFTEFEAESSKRIDALELIPAVIQLQAQVEDLTSLSNSLLSEVTVLKNMLEDMRQGTIV
jgi:hypothetical protein